MKARVFIGSVQGTALCVLLLVLLCAYVSIPRAEALQAYRIHPIALLLASLFFFDKLLLMIHLFRSKTNHSTLACDPEKLSILIVCRNGESVIGKTIEGALSHVPPNQVIVVSDMSTDRTVEVAHSYGVRVIENSRRLQKAMSINQVAEAITTPYVMVLDDDTRISGITIPTNLLDEGYSAVSFSIHPEQDDERLVIGFQTFEYRRSMILGKDLRGFIGGVSNVSGAIGLFRASDLQFQSTRHTGQYGGEDQQRTALVHLYSSGRGVTFVDETVRTLVPDTWKRLFKQRGLKWNRSVHESFWLFWKMLWHPRIPFILKLDRMYALFIFLSDPIRLLGWTAGVFTVTRQTLWLIPFLYVFSLMLELLVYAKTGKRDSLRIVLLYPLYSKFRTLTRFVAYFWWLKVKYHYFVTFQTHKFVTERRLSFEYGSTVMLMVIMWTLGIMTITW